MTTPFWIAAFAALACLLGWILTSLRLYGYKERAASLTDAIEDFLAGRRHGLSLSVRDDAFARLENAAAELQYRCVQEREKGERQLTEEANFLADVSHQFKTPLTALRLFAEMDMPAHRSETIELLDRMEHLIYELLRLEKLKSGAYALTFEETALAPLLEDVFGEFRPLYPEISLTHTGEASLRCDRTYLWEAIGNVVKNACQHAKTRVMVTLEPLSGSVMLTVEDDGGGVEEGRLPQIFSRFGPLSGKDPKSTGLGLAIAREIVEKHHGTILAENGVTGLRVSLCFPIVEGNLAIS